MLAFFYHKIKKKSTSLYKQLSFNIFYTKTFRIVKNIFNQTVN